MLELAFELPAGVLRSGSNAVQLRTPPEVTQLSFLHGLRMEYRQRLCARQPLEIAAPKCGARSVYEVAALPSEEAWVAALPEGGPPRLVPYETRREGDGAWTLRFAGRDERYFVTPRGMELTPVEVKLRTVNRLDRRTKYLAVGPAEFGEAVQPLLEARGREGLRAAFVGQEDLFDAYGFGRFGPGGIQTAVRALRPQYLLLLGRSSYDSRNYENREVGPRCPTVLVRTSLFGEAPGDPVYGDLGAGCPEVAVGRIPAYSADEVGRAVNRILNYSGGALSQYRGALVGDRPDPQAGDFHAQAENIAGMAPDIVWTRIMLGATHANAAEARAALFAEVNAGAGLVCFVGHGSSSKLAREKLLSNSPAPSEWRGNAMLLMVSCTGTWFGYNDPGAYSLAHLLLIQPEGGIPAAIGSGTYLPSAPHAEFMGELLRNSRAAGMTWGRALCAAQRWSSARTALGEAYADMAASESLLGDPALPVSAPKASLAPAKKLHREEF
jgi:hypothetical protein